MGFLVLSLLTVGLFLLVLRTLRSSNGPAPTPEPMPPTPHTPFVSPTGAYLEIVDGGSDKAPFSLQPEGSRIGRAPDNDLVVTPEFSAWQSVSKHHARLYEQAGQWIIEDLDSTNGVYVNGRRTGHNLVHDGWEVRIGGVELTFHRHSGEEQP